LRSVIVNFEYTIQTIRKGSIIQSELLKRPFTFCLPRTQPSPPIGERNPPVPEQLNSNLLRSAPSCHAAEVNFAPRSFSI
jgi:hypothetical protein